MLRIAVLFLLLAPSFLGAQDNLEMTTYYMVFLRSAPHRPAPGPDAQKLQEAHLANIRKMFLDGKLLVAGPFADDTELRGVFIFKVATMDEAKALTREDPLVKAGLLVAEFHPWMAAKGLTVQVK